MRRIVVEVTRTSIRALVVDGSPARPHIRAFAVEPLDGLPATMPARPEESKAGGSEGQAGEPSQEALRRALAGCRLAKAQVISAIPREQVVTRLLTLPSIHSDELAKMVELSGKAQLLYPPDQVVTDFQVNEQRSGTSTVQLVACHRDWVNRHMNCVSQVGLEPIAVTPSSWGLLAWYHQFGRSPEVHEPILLINVDEDRTDVVLIDHGRLMFSRGLSHGLRAWQRSPDGIGTLVQELRWSCVSLQREFPGIEVNSLIMTGLGPLDQWKGFVEEQLGKPVMIRDAEGSLRIPKHTATRPASPAVVLGLAMAEERRLVNLLPHEVRQAQHDRCRMRELAFTGALLLVTLLLGIGLLAVHVNRQAWVVEQAAKALNEVGAVTEQLEWKARTIVLIDTLFASRRRTAAMVAELFGLAAPDILFESLAFERSRGELVVRGSAPTTRQVLDYLQRLDQSDQWDQVELRHTVSHDVSSGTRTDFELVLRSK